MTRTQTIDLPYELIFRILRFCTSYQTLVELSTIPEFKSFVKSSTEVLRITIDDEIEQSNVKRFKTVLNGDGLSDKVHELRLSKEILKNTQSSLFPLIIEHTGFAQGNKSQNVSFLSIEIFVTNEVNRWDQVFQFDLLSRLELPKILKLFSHKMRVVNIDLYASKSMFVPYGYHRLQRFESATDTFVYFGYHKLHPFPYMNSVTQGVSYDFRTKSLTYTSASCLNKDTANITRASFAFPDIKDSSGFLYGRTLGEDWIEPSINIVLLNHNYEKPLSLREKERGLSRWTSISITPDASRSNSNSSSDIEMDDDITLLVRNFNKDYYTIANEHIISELKKTLTKNTCKSRQNKVLVDVLVPKPYGSQLAPEPTNHPQGIINLSDAYFHLLDLLYNKSRGGGEHHQVEFIKIKLYHDGIGTKRLLGDIRGRGELLVSEILKY